VLAVRAEMDERAPAVILGGVCLTGKSTLMRALRDRAPVVTEFFEGDDYHTEESIAKMSRGEPLEEADRGVWRDRIGGLIANRPAGKVRVITCSALTRNLRDHLRASGGLRIVYLIMSRARAEKRAAHRLATEPGHYFQPAKYPALLDGQYRDMEIPGEDEPDCLVLDLERYPDGDRVDSDALLREMMAWLNQSFRLR